MSRYACNARIMSTEPIKSGTSARTKRQTMARGGRGGEKGEGGRSETYVSTGRRGRDCSLGTGSTCILSLALSRARSVIQKLKYRLINGGSSFANSLKGLRRAAVSRPRRHHRPAVHRKRDIEEIAIHFSVSRGSNINKFEEY